MRLKKKKKCHSYNIQLFYLIIDLITPFVFFFCFSNCSCPILPHLTKMIKALSGPKYDGKYLHNILKEKLGQTKLHQTLTNVVIPTFDIKRLQPTIFSTYQVYHLLIKMDFFIDYPTFFFFFHIICGFQFLMINFGLESDCN